MGHNSDMPNWNVLQLHHRKDGHTFLQVSCFTSIQRITWHFTYICMISIPATITNIYWAEVAVDASCQMAKICD